MGRSPEGRLRKKPIQTCPLRTNRQRATAAHLPRHAVNGTVRTMYTLPRILQIIGLVIPPLAIMAQLYGSITPGQMLQFLVVSICLFMIGQLLQRHTGRPS
jgi:hypothetical protein